MALTRRMILKGAAGTAALTLAQPAFAGPKTAGWPLGYATAPAEGLGPAELEVISGRIPAGLAGRFYRNGPAQFRYGDEVLDHWFDGDGLVHRIRFGDGRAEHRARFVETPKRKAEQAAGRFLAPGFGSAGADDFAISGPDDVTAANTSVIEIDGRLYALWEAGSAFELDPDTLATIGPKAWRPDLAGMPFLAHPKREPDGRVWNLALSGSRVGIYRIAADGTLEAFHMADLGVPAYVHDWAMTETKLVILVQPWIYTRSMPPFVDGLDWRPQEGLRILFIDKDDPSQQRWSEAPAKAFFHTGAAWEEADGTIRVDAAFYDQPVLGGGSLQNVFQGRYDGVEDDIAPAELTALVIPPSGPARLEGTGLIGEFPTVDPRRHGRPRRYTALVGGSLPGRPGPHRLSVFDWQRGAAASFDYGARRIAEEHLVVPKPGGGAEADAWLVGTALNIRTGRTEVHVFELADIAAGPVASLAAPYSWPLGFHGTWAAG